MTDHTFTIDCYAGGNVATDSSAGAESAPAPQRTAGNAAAERERFYFSRNDSVYRRGHFESADTDRLNEAHWQMASETPANADLDWQLPIMRARANHEANNNPTVEGLMLSHTLAVAGEDGPLLDLQGDDDATDEWCAQAERVWEEWCAVADGAGQLSLCSLIKQWNLSCWKNGEWLEQLVNEDPQFATPGVPQLRLHGIEPQRLMTPYDSHSDPNIVLGIRRSRLRRPMEYFIADNYHYGLLQSTGTWIAANYIMHGYDSVQAERGQARGIPWIQSGLPVAADGRDYDLQVLDAARSAADSNIVAFTRHPDAEFADNVPASITYRRRQINFLAPGWEAAQTTPAQPGAQYKEHRQQLHGDLGKPRGVPSMITRLDARDHNYSSARFDYQLLGESAKHVRATLYNPRLRALCLRVLSEAILMGRLPPPPKEFQFAWVWPALPEIDEMKAAEAEQLRMRNGTRTYTEACALGHGRRARDQARRRQRDDRMLVALGLPTVAEATARNGSSTTLTTTGD